MNGSLRYSQALRLYGRHQKPPIHTNNTNKERICEITLEIGNYLLKGKGN